MRKLFPLTFLFLSFNLFAQEKTREDTSHFHEEEKNQSYLEYRKEKVRQNEEQRWRAKEVLDKSKKDKRTQPKD